MPLTVSREAKQRRRAHLLCDVEDLVQTRHTERDVLRRHAREVERVQRHLRRRLAHRLRGEHAAHFARVRTRRKEFGLDLTNEPHECALGESVLEQHAFRCELRADQDLEEQRRILLGLLADHVLARHDHELVA